MVVFFRNPQANIIAVETPQPLNAVNIQKLCWLFSGAVHLDVLEIEGKFIGPRKEMITPWSTNAV
ncbi:MAG TPA: hypothetical protein DDX98_15105, partial [Bacteroidales bacterium]|nr:hypothetical protein [Bacteroidales bacterium]